MKQTPPPPPPYLLKEESKGEKGSHPQADFI